MCITHLYVCFLRSELEEFQEGLGTYGILELMRQHPVKFRDIFCVPSSRPKMTADDIIQQFKPVFSEMGANKREEEENIYEFWIDFVRDSDQGTHP